MVHEKICKACEAKFVGFTPICKSCTLEKHQEVSTEEKSQELETPNQQRFVAPSASVHSGELSKEQEASMFNRGRFGQTQGESEPYNSKAEHIRRMENRRKTSMCKNYPNCRYSDEECNFLHPGELQTPFSHLKKMCQQFKNEGKCKYGSRCHYAHTMEHVAAHDTSIETHKTTSSLPKFGVISQADANQA